MYFIAADLLEHGRVMAGYDEPDYCAGCGCKYLQHQTYDNVVRKCPMPPMNVNAERPDDIGARHLLSCLLPPGATLLSIKQNSDRGLTFTVEYTNGSLIYEFDIMRSPARVRS